MFGTNKTDLCKFSLLHIQRPLPLQLRVILHLYRVNHTNFHLVKYSLESLNTCLHFPVVLKALVPLSKNHDM